VAETVFILCALTSIVCFALLLRGYRRSRATLIMWAALCFAGFAINNVLLVVDEVIASNVDIPWRALPATIGVCALLYGLATEQP
jgi:hypothetical protein